MAASNHPNIEDLYRESPSIALVVLDEGGTILSANPCLHRILGLEPGRAVGRWFPGLLNGKDEAAGKAWLAARLADLRGATHEEAWTRADGGAVPVRQTCIPVAGEGGPRLYCWGRDISEERFLEVKAREASELHRALAEGILALSLCRSENELTQVLLGRAAAVFPTTHWALGHVVEEGGVREAEMKAATPALDQYFGHALIGMRVPIVDSPFSRRLYQEREISFVRDNDAEPGQLNPLFVDAYGVRSFLGVPLLRDNHVVGALYAVAFRGDEPLAPTEGQLAGLQNLGRVGALVWHRLLVQGQLQGQVNRAETLYRQLVDFQAAASEVARDQDLDHLLRVLMEMVADAAHIDACEVYQLDPVRGLLRRIAHTGLPRPLLDILDELPLEGEGRAVSGEAVASGQAVVIPDIQTFPRAEAARQLYLAEGFQASVSVPLRSHRGTVLGAFTVSSRAAGAPSQEAMDQIEFFANLAGLALDRVDLAARLQVEQVQRTQTEALYRCLVEDGLDGVYLIQEGKVRYVSAKLEQTLLYGPGELLGMSMERIVHPDDLPRVVENLRQRLEGEVSTLRYPIRAIRKDGVEIPVEVQGSRVFFEGRAAVLGVAHDNRDRLATQAALQKNSERARILAESAQAFGLAQDESALLQALFQGAQNLTGLPHWWHNRYDAAAQASITTHWSPELSVRFSESRLTAPILLKDNPMREDPHLNRACVWIEDCREVPDFSSTYLEEIPHRAMLAVPMPEGLGPAGALFGGTFGDEPRVVLDEEQIGAVRSLAGSAGLALSRLRALAEAQAREMEYRQLFDQAAEAVLIAELDGTWVRVNQAACALFGYTEAEFLGKRAGFSSPEIQPDGRPTRDVLALFTEMGREGRRGGFDFTTHRKDGSLIHCELSVAPLQKEGRTLVQVVLRDRTEARRAAEEKAALERQLYEAKKMESLGVMASGVAHDFNNLLMGVLGNAGLALEELGPAHPLATNLQAIQEAAHRASDLTRQLMAYTGRGQFSLDELDLSMEVREMRQLLEAGLPPGIALELDLAPEMPPFEGDHHQIQQVLANLLVNATEAIGDQAGWVRITTTPVRLSAADIAADLPGQELEPGDFVRLEIRDSGPGMDSALVGRVFEPFFTTKFQGRGLGLPAVLGIVRGHRGGVKLDSAPGAGTRCAIYFPVSTRRAP